MSRRRTWICALAIPLCELTVGCFFECGIGNVEFEIAESYTLLEIYDVQTNELVGGALTKAKGVELGFCADPSADEVCTEPTDAEGRSLVPVRLETNENKAPRDRMLGIVIEFDGCSEELTYRNATGQETIGDCFGLRVLDANAPVPEPTPLSVAIGSNPPVIFVRQYVTSVTYCIDGFAGWSFAPSASWAYLGDLTLEEPEPECFYETTGISFIPCGLAGETATNERVLIIDLPGELVVRPIIFRFCVDASGTVVECLSE